MQVIQHYICVPCHRCFGKYGRLLLTMTFINLVTRGCCPAKWSPNIVNEDSADRVVFNALEKCSKKFSNRIKRW